MPVTAKLSKRFYDVLGEDIANELVDWFNAVDLTPRFARGELYRADLRELNELNYARFEAKLEQRLAELRAELRAEIAGLRAEVRTDPRAASEPPPRKNDIRSSITRNRLILPRASSNTSANSHPPSSPQGSAVKRSLPHAITWPSTRAVIDLPERHQLTERGEVVHDRLPARVSPGIRAHLLRRPPRTARPPRGGRASARGRPPRSRSTARLTAVMSSIANLPFIRNGGDVTLSEAKGPIPAGSPSLRSG